MVYFAIVKKSKRIMSMERGVEVVEYWPSARGACASERIIGLEDLDLLGIFLEAEYLKMMNRIPEKICLTVILIL